MPELNSGDTAWILAASALVLIMTPGVAFFYGGMVRAKSVLNMLMMSFAALAIVSVLWVFYGYSLSFAPDAAGNLIGDLSIAWMNDTIGTASGTIPHLAFAAFQLMFAIITVALISGAIADRAKFGAWIVFVVLWATLVYFPVAHWVFAFGADASLATNDGGGWIADRIGAIDFAGGTAVHINSGAAALALAFVLGKRLGWRKDPMRPHSLPLTVLGAALLWFGWFGFNAGSALTAGDLAAVTFFNTQVATAAAVIGWLIVEKIRDGHFTTLGAASGAVAGLVAITPACSSVTPMGALAVGLIGGAVCALAIGLKYRFGFDDSLDVVGVHLFGGLTGTLLIGLIASPAAPAAAEGLLLGGGFERLKIQAIAAFAVMGYSFVVSLILGFIIDKTIGFRVPEDDEISGIDLALHAETAYELGAGTAPHSRISSPASTEKVEA